jgi:hypothetical protein
VTIEILDSSGALVRRASSADPAPFTQAQLDRELVPAYWIRMVRPPAASAGMHRWIWDLHYAPPRTVKRGFPISAVPGDTPQEPLGPPANVGAYRVRLSMGLRHWEQALNITPDPRIKIDLKDFSAQFDLAQRLAAALDGSTGALLAARSIRAQLKEPSASAGANLAGQSRLLDLHITELVGSGDQSAASKRGLEQLNGDLATLYTQITDVDAAPTTVQALESELALKEWSALEVEWQRLRDGEVAQLNRSLKLARLPRLRADLEPPRDLDLADQE